MLAHTITIRVRYCECDPMGVVHHSVHAVWFEMGRTELLRAGGGRYRDLETAGVFLVVVDLAVRYRRPARYDDELALTTTLDSVGHVKIVHRYELRRDADLIATGSTTLVCVDRAGEVRPVPEEIRA